MSHPARPHSSVSWTLYLQEPLKEIVDLEFETTLMLLLEQGRVHLDTTWEMRLKTPVVECICFRLQEELYRSDHDGIHIDIPHRARTEMEDLLSSLFAPHPALEASASARSFSRSWMDALRRFFSTKTFL